MSRGRVKGGKLAFSILLEPCAIFERPSVLLIHPENPVNPV
jgi:hypothetical protein